MCCQDVVETVQSGKAGKQACGKFEAIHPKPQDCVQYVNQSSLKFAAKTQYSQFSVGKQESGQVGNLKQLGRLWHGILGGICSPEPQSCVCQFEVGKQESRQLGNLKQFGRLWCGILGGICSPEPQSCVCSKWERGKAGTWEIRPGDIGNLKQLSRLQCGVLDGICSPEPHSCVLCINQPPFKFATKMWYTQFKVGKQESRQLGNLSQFKVGKQESRQLGNLKQFGRLWHGILGGICSPDPEGCFHPEPQSCVQCANWPPFKFATKRWYSHFEAGKQESGHLGN
ncbi:hypothetical protein B0H13DRAFT_1886976 [Mycena leptocephala]|nr:hypothetical protein B0H13DRAFT_1886975 [Mycena leptocephala]KAJ7891952.1 hypothetical protein B0H13DRAFT_1886976 [Mycena leptocephala]